jgi:hypothetical protein
MSFISVEPQPRAVLESHSNSLLSQFDTRLRIITDRYLAFFQERFIDLVQDFRFTLNIRLSGETLRQSSQLSFAKLNVYIDRFDSPEVLTLYRNSIASQKPSIPHLTPVLNQLRRGRHGIH